MKKKDLVKRIAGVEISNKRWMVVAKSDRHILLHYNEDLEQYKKMKRVPNWIVKRYLL